MLKQQRKRKKYKNMNLLSYPFALLGQLVVSTLIQREILAIDKLMYQTIFAEWLFNKNYNTSQTKIELNVDGRQIKKKNDIVRYPAIRLKGSY